jgi:hypothetical protein
MQTEEIISVSLAVITALSFGSIFVSILVRVIKGKKHRPTGSDTPTYRRERELLQH